jgi:L-cystine transport system substrate-binding protein
MKPGDQQTTLFIVQTKELGMRLKLGLLATALAGLIAIASARADCLDTIRSAGIITSGSGVMGVKPSLWQDQDGTYHGFDYEIFQQIAKRIGVPKTKFIVTEWTTLIPGLKADRWDIILSDMAVNQERIHNAHIDFSRPYFLLYDFVIVKQDSPIKTMADLKGKTLGSTLGTLDSLNAHQLVQAGEAGKVLDFETFGDPFVALQNGQVDAVILDQGTLMGQREKMKNLRTVGGPISYHAKPEWAAAEAKASYRLGSLAIAVRPECPALLAAINGAISDMDKDGTRKAILTKYGVWTDKQANLMK